MNRDFSASSWKEVADKAQDAYWLARRFGRDERTSLLHAIDTVVAALTEKEKA